MSNIMDGFKVTLLVMAFYSVAITIIAYSLPTDSKDFISTYELVNFKYQDMGDKMQNSLSKQTNVPIIDLGALVFFSGNILIDLLVNFLYAIPQMIGLLIKIFTTIFNVDGGLIIIVQTFSSVIITALYVVGLIQLLAGIRSGQAGIL